MTNLLKAIGLVALGAGWLILCVWGFEFLWGPSVDYGWGILGGAFAVITAVAVSIITVAYNESDEEAKRRANDRY